ncbi:hypothetical protein MF271_19195 (plasmid) [Deinococcus sp. KNUC1210]|uniref:hypothetical protein n=1 Tax=Deinococcus sp. KNUC1210 TaxID=2917691 RepID=UPI001EEFC081|nr:hypothetical protein [Deinococcus sp. KNUC1210]ULH17446.1 hypothetical protein MF271_19195 [Deinococcus sp. KNUC1210]
MIYFLETNQPPSLTAVTSRTSRHQTDAADPQTLQGTLYQHVKAVGARGSGDPHAPLVSVAAYTDTLIVQAYHNGTDWHYSSTRQDARGPRSPAGGRGHAPQN